MHALKTKTWLPDQFFLQLCPLKLSGHFPQSVLIASTTHTLCVNRGPLDAYSCLSITPEITPVKFPICAMGTTLCQIVFLGRG